MKTYNYIKCQNVGENSIKHILIEQFFFLNTFLQRKHLKQVTSNTAYTHLMEVTEKKSNQYVQNPQSRGFEGEDNSYEETSQTGSWDVEKERKEVVPSSNNEGSLLQQNISKQNNQSSSFMKISDITARTEKYNIVAKVVACEELLMFKRNIPYVRVKLADETGCADGFFKGQNCQLFKIGNILQIKSGVIKIDRGHISLELNAEGRITLITTTVIKENTELNISATFIERRGGYRGQRGNHGRGHYPQYRDNPPRRQETYRGHKQTRYSDSYRGQPYRGQREKRYAETRYKNQYDRNGRYDRIAVYQQRRGQNHYNQPSRYSNSKRDFHNNDYESRRAPRRFEDQRPMLQNNFRRQQMNGQYSRPINHERVYERTQMRRSSSKSRYNMDRVSGRENRKYKICEIKPSDETISLVALISKLVVRLNCFFLELKDETGTIDAYLPTRLPQLDYDHIREENIIVIYLVKVQLRNGKREIVFGEKSKVSTARFNLDLFYNLKRSTR